MANRIVLKKSSVSSKVPLATDLEYGELALNYTDEKLYFKNASNVIKSLNVTPATLTIGTGLSGTSYNGTSAVTIAINSTVATLTGTQTLTNKTISGASNTLSNIGNSSLTNSSVTIGSTSVSLGATATTLAGLTSVTSTSFVGELTGNASTSTTATNVTATANNSTNETTYITFVDGATGAQGIETDTGLTYNPSTGALTSTSFVGALTGNASTATTAAAWTTARTITLGGDLSGSVSINGSANVTLTATIAANSVALGTDTTGNYVAGATAGTGIAITGTAGEGWSPTISLLASDLTLFPSSNFKKSVRVATTANITLSGTQTIDGIAVVAGNRVLVKNQTTASQNGIYVVASGAWTRSVAADGSTEIDSAVVGVDEGTANGGLFYTNTFKSTHVVGTTAMPWYKVTTELDNLTSGSTAVGTVTYSGTTNTAGQFNGGTTTPNGSTRLNYSGYFYPTFINLTGSGETATAATHYFVETGSDGFVRPKTLANVRTEIVTTAAVNSAALTTTGTVTSGTWSASFGAVSGANLTSLNASNLGSGTVPDARISGSYTGMTNLTGTGTVDFAKFLGNAADTAALPSFSWTGDLNTGIYQPAADQLGFTTGGTSRLTITTTAIASTLPISASTFTGALSGNATTATTLQTARTINSVSFNGSANITVEPYVEDDEATNATRLITFVDNSTAGFKRLNEDSSLNYNPSTGTVITNGAFASTFALNKNTIDVSYSIPTGYNAVAAGPVVINNGITVTIPTGSTWVIV